MDDRCDRNRQGLCLRQHRQQAETERLTPDTLAPGGALGDWWTLPAILSGTQGRSGVSPCGKAGSVVSMPDGEEDVLKSFVPHNALVGFDFFV